MKKQSKTTTVYRMDLEKGNYTTVARKILLDTNLTDSAKTLVQLCLNNVDGWKLSLNYYKKQLKWSNDKMAGAVENLITEGYMTKEKKPNGKNGFTYIYVISEFGNLNPNKEQPSVEQISESIELDESSEIIVNEAPVQSETPQVAETSKEVAEATADSIEEPLQPEASSNTVAEATTETTSDVVHKEFNERLINVLSELIEEYRLSDNFMNKIVNYYLDEIEKGNSKVLNTTSELMHKQITNSIQKNEAAAIKQIEGWIEIHNNRGTKDQRANIKTKALIYFKDKTKWKHPLEEVIEKDVSTRLLYLKSSVIDANREYDQRYQN
jgi:hypothetical protein